MPDLRQADKVLGPAAVIAVLILGTCLTNFKARDTDLPLHLKTGEWVMKHHQVPRTDIYNFTRETEPWIDAYVLFQLLCFGALRALGEAGPTALTMLLAFILLLLLLVNRPKELGLGLGALIVLGTALGASARLHLRPELLSCIYLTAMFGLAERAYSGRVRWLALAPLVQWLWANSEGVWPLGLIVLGAYQAEVFLRAWRDKRRSRRELLPPAWLGAMAASVAANLAQPYGLRGCLFPLIFVKQATSAVTLHNRIIIEMQPLFSDLPTPGGFYFFLPLAIVTVAVSVAAGKKLRPFLSLLGLLTIDLALSARRNVSIASVTCAPLLMLHGREFMQARFSDRGRKRIGLAAAGLVLGLALTVGLLTRVQNPWRWDGSYREPGFGFQWEFYPRPAAAFLKTIGYKGNIIDNFDIGGYLIWAGWPDWKVMADGRVGDEALAQWAQVYLDPAAFHAMADKFQVEAVVVTVHIHDLRVFADRVRRDPDWALVFIDPVSRCEVFLRRAPKWKQVISDNEIFE